jgi:DNA-binding transcriptional LysR family regulator
MHPLDYAAPNSSLTRGFMNLRQLLYFKTIVERKSIAAASEVLHIAQPPLSQHIKGMEAEYGVRLFERKGRGLQVTQAGMHLYVRACELLSLADEVDSQMHAWAKGLKGKVSIGTVAAGVTVLARIVSQLKRELPDVVFSIHLGEPDTLEKLIEERQLDFAVTQWPVGSASLQSEPLLDLPLAGLHAGFESSDKEAGFSLSDLAAAPLILLKRKHGSGVYERINQAFLDLGYRPTVAFECSDTSAALALATTGAGIALVPQWKEELVPAGLHRFWVPELDTREQLVLAWLQDREHLPAVELAVQAIRQISSETWSNFR